MYGDLVKLLRELPHFLFVQLHGHEDVVYQAADAIEELQAGEKKFLRNISALEMENENLKRARRWIPTTERLPEDGDNVIVCTKSGNVGEAKYQAALGYDLNYPEIWFLLNDYGNQYQTEEVVAWMPLPEPPAEEPEVERQETIEDITGRARK